MNDSGKSSFARLVEYITDDQNNELRVQDVRITNCTTERMADAVREILNSQQGNTRSKKDKTLHCLLSFHPEDGSILTEENRRQIEDDFCRMIGYGEHQRISAYHGDTDNPHIHIAINRIDHRTNKIHNPDHLWNRMGKAAAYIEKKYGVTVDPHKGDRTQSRTQSENRVQDAESMSSEETLCSYVKQIQDLQNAKTWEDFMRICRENHIRIKKRGNGFVFSTEDGRYTVKASTVNRNFSKSKLERLYGAFPDNAEDEPEQEQGQEQTGNTPHRPTPDEIINRPQEREREAAEEREARPERQYTNKKPNKDRELLNEAQRRLYADFLHERTEMRYAERKEQYFSETKRKLQRLARQRREEMQRIVRSHIPCMFKRHLLNRLNRQIQKERERYIYAQRYLNRKLNARGTWKGYLHQKALEGNHTAIGLLERQKKRIYETEQIQRLEIRLQAAGQVIFTTKGGTRIYKTTHHYVRISKERIQVQRIAPNRRNLYHINWHEGFTGIPFSEIARSDPDISKMIQEQRQRRQEAENRRQEEHRRRQIFTAMRNAAAYLARKAAEKAKQITEQVKGWKR